MNEILMTNIFFMITALSSIVITIVLVIALVYIIKIVKRVERISDAVETETLKIIDDVDDARVSLKKQVQQLNGGAFTVIAKAIVQKLFNRN